MQHSGHAFSTRLLSARSPLRLLIKMSGKVIFSLFAQIPSLQLVTGLSNSNKTGARGHVLVQGPWDGLVEHPDFRPRHTLSIPSRIGSFFPLFALCSLLVVVLVLAFLFCVTQARK